MYDFEEISADFVFEIG